MDLSAIKSEKLKALLEASLKFNALPEKSKNSQIRKMARAGIYIQDTVYSRFFEEENKKEQAQVLNKAKMLQMLIDKAEELEKSMKKLQIEAVEATEENNEESEQKKLLQKLEET